MAVGATLGLDNLYLGHVPFWCVLLDGVQGLMPPVNAEHCGPPASAARQQLHEPFSTDTRHRLSPRRVRQHKGEAKALS